MGTLRPSSACPAHNATCPHPAHSGPHFNSVQGYQIMDPSDTIGVPCSALPVLLLSWWTSYLWSRLVSSPAASDCPDHLDGPQTWFLALSCQDLLMDLVTSSWVCTPFSDPVGLCLVRKGLCWGCPCFQLSPLMLLENYCMIVWRYIIKIPLQCQLHKKQTIK